MADKNNNYYLLLSLINFKDLPQRSQWINAKNTKN